MIRYVCGLLFSDDRKHVVLLEKRRGPTEIIGKMVGPGGKVDWGESTLQAVRREFKEETGLIVLDWEPTVVLWGSNWGMNVFRSFAPLDVLRCVRTVEEEPVGVYEIATLGQLQLASGMDWIIPLSLDEAGIKGTVEQTTGFTV